jgi:hypothetical protein
MKGSEVFKSTIHAYLQGRAINDPLFAETLKKPNKNIDDCITYILNTVKNSGCNGFADQEVYDMAVHYYDEDNINIGNKISSGNVVVNHHADLIIGNPKSATPKTKKPSKEAIVKKPEIKKAQPQPTNVLTLF